LLVRVVVDAGRQRRLWTIADRRDTEVAPAASIAARQAHHKGWRSAAHESRRSHQLDHQWVAERSPIGVPALAHGDADGPAVRLVADHRLTCLRADAGWKPDINLCLRPCRHLAANRAGY